MKNEKKNTEKKEIKIQKQNKKTGKTIMKSSQREL